MDFRKPCLRSRADIIAVGFYRDPLNFNFVSEFIKKVCILGAQPGLRGF